MFHLLITLMRSMALLKCIWCSNNFYIVHCLVPVSSILIPSYVPGFRVKPHALSSHSGFIFTNQKLLCDLKKSIDPLSGAQEYRAGSLLSWPYTLDSCQPNS